MLFIAVSSQASLATETQRHRENAKD
jgi:hypothetical protein